MVGRKWHMFVQDNLHVPTVQQKLCFVFSRFSKEYQWKKTDAFKKSMFPDWKISAYYPT